jgi:hypothetical protein
MTSQMPTNPLLVAVSAAYAICGLALLFATDEIMASLAPGTPPFALWIAGLLGGALTAFAMLNWLQRHTLMGGIYGRPLLVANLLLLSNTTFSALRMWRSQHAPVYAIVGLIGGAFFVAFGRLMFRNPPALRDGTGAAPS